MRSEDRVDRLEFGAVAFRRRRCVGIEVIDLGGIEPGLGECASRGPDRADPAGRGEGDVGCVGRGPVAHDLGQGLGTAGVRVGQRFEHEHAAPLADHEPIPAFVEWTGRPFRIVVPRRQGLHRRKTADHRLVDDRLRTPGKHHLRIAAPDRFPRFPDCVGARGTGRHDREVRSQWTERNGHLAGADIGDPHRNEERADSIRPALTHQEHVVEQCRHAAESRAQDHAGSLGKRSVHPARKPRLIESLARRHETELDVSIRSSHVLTIKHATRIEVTDLAGDPRGEAPGVERLDRPDSGSTREQAVPCRRDIVAEC